MELTAKNASRLVGCIGLTFFVFATPSDARPVDLSQPTNSLGASNSQGFIERWSELGRVTVNEALSLPLRIGFSSDPQKTGMLGKGFTIPLFEARAYLLREKMLRATLPCGKALYLRQDQSNHPTFKTLDIEWTAQIQGNSIIITREDGWALRYQDGRLSTLTTDHGKDVHWSYPEPSRIEVRDDQSLLATFNYDVTEKKGTLNANGKISEFSMTRRPHTAEIAGQKVIEGFDDVLGSYKTPDGKLDRYEFSITEDREPKLVQTDVNGIATEYTWDAASGRILSENTWKYTIGKKEGDFDRPAISRIDAGGKIEAFQVDKQNGTVVQTKADGDVITTYLFKAPGLTYNKVFKIEETHKGVVKTTARISYDDLGRCIRKIDERGYGVTFKYTPSGRAVAEAFITKEPQVLAEVHQRESSLLAELKLTENKEVKRRLLEKLSNLYILELGQPASALSLIALIDNPLQAFNLEILAISKDLSLTPEEKISRLKPLASKYPSFTKTINTLILINSKKIEDKS